MNKCIWCEFSQNMVISLDTRAKIGKKFKTDLGGSLAQNKDWFSQFVTIFSCQTRAVLKS